MTAHASPIATQRPGVTLRPATRNDVPLILALIRELAEYEREPDAVQADEAMLAANLFGDAPGAEVVIADVDGRPAGFALFFHNFSTWLGRRGLHLEDLFVRPEFRGRGVGHVLMTYLAKLAVERGCGRFEWSVLDWNTPAIDFYRRVGAVGMEEWTVQRLSGDAMRALATSFDASRNGP
ncbi:GNAT family N-acetyltransferase [Lysobacter tyrosinilyticus]